MISDLGNRVLEYEPSDWINLTPKEMMSCYTTICRTFRKQIADFPDVEDVEHRVKIMYDALVDNQHLLFYFCQRYPRQFHTITNRTVPKWYWQNFMHFFYQTQIFVEEGLMTIERRQQAIEDKFAELQPEDDDWKRNDDYKTYALMPRKFEMTPELRAAIQGLRQSRTQKGMRAETRDKTRDDARVETRVETREETRVETRVETREETRDDARAETRDETRDDARVETRAETRDETRVDARDEDDK